MRHKILIIDDRWDERQPIYNNLVNHIEGDAVHSWKDFEIDLVYAKAEYEVEHLMRHNDFSAVILDIVLDNWKTKSGKPVLASAMLNVVKDNKIPVFLLSGHWASEPVKELVAKWPTRNCKMFILWDDLKNANAKNQNLSRILYTMRIHIEEYRKLDHSVELNADDPIRILHLSDLQFGGSNGWSSKENLVPCVRAIKKLWPEGPTFVAITGDIAQHGLPSEYETALNWLNGLLINFKYVFPSRRILIVPGNHDVCIPFSAAAYLKFPDKIKTSSVKKGTAKTKSGKEKPRRMEFAVDLVNDFADYAYRPFLDFQARITQRQFLPIGEHSSRGEASKYSYPWVEAHFRQYGIIFFGLNTAQPPNGRQLTDRKTDKHAVEDVVQEINTFKPTSEEQLMVIGLSHHSPYGDVKERSVENPEDFSLAFTDMPGMAVWLYGHAHQRSVVCNQPNQNSTHVVFSAAPTMTVDEEDRPKDTLRGFTMITIERKDGKIKSCETVPVEWETDTLVVRKEKPNKKVFKRKKGSNYFTPE